MAYTAFAMNAAVPLHVSALGGTTNVTGLLNTSFTICACVFRLGGGFLADRFGRKRILLIGGAVFAAATFVYAWITGLALLIIVRGLQGAGFALMSIGCSTALVDVLPAERFGESLGYYSLASTVASSVASAAAIAVIAAAGYFATFSSSAVVVLAGALVILLFCSYERKPEFIEEQRQAREKKAAEGENRISLRDFFEPQAVMPAVVSTLYGTGVAISYVYISLYAVEEGIPNPGLYFTFSSVFAVVARIIGGKLADRDNVLPGLLLGFVLCIVSYALLFLPDSSGSWYCAAGALFGISGGFVSPILNRIAIHGVASDRRGAASATFSISNDVGTGLGGLLWGATIASWGFMPSFLAVIVWLGFSTVFMVVYMVLRRRRQISA